MILVFRMNKDAFQYCTPCTDCLSGGRGERVREGDAGDGDNRIGNGKRERERKKKEQVLKTR